MKKENTSGTSYKGVSIFIILILFALCLGIFAFLQFSDFAAVKSFDRSETADNGTAAPLETASADSQLQSSAGAPLPPAGAVGGQTVNTGVSPYVIPQYPVSPQRVTLTEGFYYEPVDGNTELMDRIRNLSYQESINTKISFDKLSYVRVKYINFQDQEAEGELICSKLIAQDLTEIFYDLYQARYQIESVRLVDDFGGDDTASMNANNTSAFNYRLTTGTTNTISEHSWGYCIDINPLYNPYVASSDGVTVVAPAAGAPYVDRTQDFPHKIDENDLCYQLFTKHGFTWGGNWNSVKDYQHFQKNTEQIPQ